MQSLTEISPQASVSEPAAALTPETSAASAPSVDLPTPRTPSNNDSDSVVESGQPKFVESGQPKFSIAPTYAGSPSSFSYGVLPKTNSTTLSSEENSSTPTMKASPSASDASVQFPVPGQPVATGPAFSYNIVTSNSAGSSNGQQLQSNNVTGSLHLEGLASSIPSTESSLQPPGKSEHPNIYVHGTARNLPDQIHSPVPIPKGTPSIAAGFSFSRPSQLPAAVNASSQQTTSTATIREAGMSTSSSTGSQSVSLHAYPSLSHSNSAPVAPTFFPANPWMPANVPFPSHPGVVVNPATPGPPGIPLAGSFCSNMSIRPMAPGLPLPASLPMNSAVQQQIYPPFQSVPAMAPPPQPHWLQPPQITGMQRPPYVPYPAVITNSYPLPVRGLVAPSVTDSQPPGFSPVGHPGGTTPSSMELVQHVSSSGVQSELPPGADHDEKANGHGDPVNDAEVDAWTAHKTDTGAVYYYNAVTGESTYEKPHSFKGEPDKVTAQSTPVSWEKLAGTDWVLATTDDAKRYYYNSKTKVSSWQIPAEVTELMKKKQEGDLRANTMSVPNASTLSEKGSVSNSLSTPAVNTGGRDAVALRASVLPGSSSALDLIKKKLQDSGVPVTSSTVSASSGPSTAEVNGLKAVDTTINGPQGENSKDKLKDGNGEGNLSDSSSDSEDVESGPSKEDCVIQFKEMLKERGVAPFSKWEKELPKIVFDPRFKAVPSHSTRRSLFDHYVRTRAEEERKEKRAAQKAAVEGFRQLLEEASEDIDHKTDYQSFRKKWGDDPRFKALDRKEREVLLNERVLSLRRAAEEKIRAAREAAASSFKSMLRDKGDINPNTRWSKVKDSLRSDPRYKSVKHDDREVLFNEYISELRAAEEEVDRAAKAKREELDKLKEREREMRKRKEREEQDMERVRLKIRRKEATSSFQTLLVETIKDPQASWTESKPKLERDPQGRATHPDLDEGDAEKLFREHVKALYERCVSDFHALLAEVLSTEAVERVTEDGKSALTSWSTAKRFIKPDPRYTKMPRKDRESMWKRYADEIQRKRKLASDPTEDRLNSDKKSKISLDSGKSPAGSRRVRDHR